MAVKKGKKMDQKNIWIVVLVLVVCAETFLLYKVGPDRITDLFAEKKSVQQSASAKKTVKSPASVAPKATSVAAVPAAVIPVAPAKGLARAVIILDDWGYNTKNCQYLRDIKSPITVAVLPNLKHSADVMQCAHDAGKELMLHLPMEPHSNPDQYPEDYIIKTTMSQIKVDNLLSDILDKMPLIDGVNNHMGSKATEDRRLMTTIFRQLRHRNLFYVDSRVTAKSVCAPVAKEIGVRFVARDVFLDNVNERGAITKELNNLARIAKKRGWAVAIGHDRSLTLQVIQERLPWFKQQGIEFVTVNEIIAQ